MVTWVCTEEKEDGCILIKLYISRATDSKNLLNSCKAIEQRISCISCSNNSLMSHYLQEGILFSFIFSKVPIDLDHAVAIFVKFPVHMYNYTTNFHCMQGTWLFPLPASVLSHAFALKKNLLGCAVIKLDTLLYSQNKTKLWSKIYLVQSWWSLSDVLTFQCNCCSNGGGGPFTTILRHC